MSRASFEMSGGRASLSRPEYPLGYGLGADAIAPRSSINQIRVSQSLEAGDEKLARRRGESYLLTTATTSFLLALGDILAIMLYAIATGDDDNYSSVFPQIGDDNKSGPSSSSSSSSSGSSSSSSSSFSFPTIAPTTFDASLSFTTLQGKQKQVQTVAICLAMAATLAFFSGLCNLSVYSRTMGRPDLAFFRMKNKIWSWLSGLLTVAVILNLIALIFAMSILYPNYSKANMRNKGLAAGMTTGTVIFGFLYSAFVIYAA